MSRTDLGRLIDVLLYEGYSLFPYRAEALKNQERWTFGSVYPRSFSQRLSGTYPCQVQTECLIEGERGAVVESTLTFLQAVQVGDHEEAVRREFIVCCALGSRERHRAVK